VDYDGLSERISCVDYDELEGNFTGLCWTLRQFYWTVLDYDGLCANFIGLCWIMMDSARISLDCDGLRGILREFHCIMMDYNGFQWNPFIGL